MFIQPTFFDDFEQPRKQSHREDAKLYAREKRRVARANGICGNCCINKAKDGRRLCQLCLDSFKTQRIQRNRDGICQCGLRKLPEGKSCCEKCRECFRKSEKSKVKRRKENRLCTKCGVPSEHGFFRCFACRKKESEKRLSIRQEIFAAYGGPKCTCCGTENVEFLTLEHVDNDGAAHRRELRCDKGYRFYKKLKQLGFPQTRRMVVMCFNCNISRNCFGYCPCQRGSSSTGQRSSPCNGDRVSADQSCIGTQHGLENDGVGSSTG